MSGEATFPLQVFALVAAFIAMTALVAGQFRPTSGMIVVALASTIWVAVVARRGAIIRGKNG